MTGLAIGQPSSHACAPVFVHFHQHGHVQATGNGLQVGHLCIIQAGRNQQDAVRPHRAGLIDLVGVDHEILAQRRQLRGLTRNGFEHGGQDAVFLSYREFVESIQVPPGREASWRDFTGWFPRVAQNLKGVDAHQAFEEIRGVLEVELDIRETVDLRAAKVFEGMGIIHAVLSYCGSITVTFTSDRSIIANPDVYAQCLQESFEELKAAAMKRPVAPPPAKPEAVVEAPKADAAPAKKAKPRKRKPKLTIVSAAE